MMRVITVGILFGISSSTEISSSLVLSNEETIKLLFPRNDPSQLMRSQNKQVGLEAFGMNMDAFNYGCHCNAIMTGKQTGQGKPVDALDSVCKDYLGCLRCVKKQTNCPRAEFYDYFVGDMTVVCFDEEGSCSRNQCECDAKFYKDVWHLALSGLSYDFQYSSSVFDALSKCKKLETRMDAFWTSLKQDSYAQCCGGDGRPMEQFNTLKFSCCPGNDGTLTLRRRC